jgi:hypothetical protein
VSGGRAVLNIRYTPVGPGAGKKAGRLTNYIQNRDNERPEAEIRDPESFMYYAAYRDRAQPEGRMFDADGTVGTEERLDLVQNIRDSIQGAREGDRAFYQVVISPEDARGVDLRALTRATMAQVQRDCGPLRWIAAEHRNTEHPHSHVVMAARRENEPGHYKTVVINRPRLERMKGAMTNELSRQHDHGNQMGQPAGPQLGRAVNEMSLNRRPAQALSRAVDGSRGLAASVSASHGQTRPQTHHIGRAMGAMGGFVAGMLRSGEVIRQEIERREREREREHDHGWER